MDMSSKKGSAFSFGLRFTRKHEVWDLVPGRILYPSTFVMEEGRTVASFPDQNAVNYSNNANHFMLIARPSGRKFNLTFTFMDIEGKGDYLRRFVIEERRQIDTFFTYYGG